MHSHPNWSYSSAPSPLFAIQVRLIFLLLVNFIHVLDNQQRQELKKQLQGTRNLVTILIYEPRHQHISSSKILHRCYCLYGGASPRLASVILLCPPGTQVPERATLTLYCNCLCVCLSVFPTYFEFCGAKICVSLALD